MILKTDETPLFSAMTLSQAAEKELIAVLLAEDFLSDPVLHRELASYAITDEMEKDRLILDLMKILWQRYSLHGLFTVFKDFDTFFAVLGKKGHFIHQFEVFLLGWYLMKRLIGLKPLSTKLSRFGDVQEIFSTWLITSTAHDLGYPVAVASEVITVLAKLYENLGADNLSHKYCSVQREFAQMAELDLINMKSPSLSGNRSSVDIREFITGGVVETLGIDISSAETLLRSLESKNTDLHNHGYVTAVLLCNAYIRSLPPTLNRQRETGDLDRIKLASAAIALHAAPQELYKDIRKVSFVRNPYAYILFMVDNLQDWSRNLRPNERYPSYNLLGIEFKQDDNELMISYVLTHSKWTNEIENLLTKSLSEKREKLKLLSDQSPPLGIKVHVKWYRYSGHLEKCVIGTKLLEVKNDNEEKELFETI